MRTSRYAKYDDTPAIDGTDILRAIENDEFVLYYQPRVSLNEKDDCYEALMRWDHPVLGRLSPDKFIPVAESSGLICELGLWAFETACSDLRWFDTQNTARLKLSINLSLVQCEDRYYAHRLHVICRRYRLDFSRFEFELTESQALTQRNRVIDFCRTLIDLGASISLDDFGTGYSTLEQLYSLPIDTIKLDRSFISDIGKTEYAGTFITSIITLAHSLGIQVVAEGVETRTQLEELLEMGCDQVQGFYMQQPLPRESILLSDCPLTPM